MINLLRDLRHHDSLKNVLPWGKIGVIYRFIIQTLPFDFNN